MKEIKISYLDKVWVIIIPQGYSVSDFFEKNAPRIVEELHDLEKTK